MKDDGWTAGQAMVPFPELKLQAAHAVLRLGQPHLKGAGRGGMQAAMRGLVLGYLTDA